jgi:hypothetical protein
MKREHEVNGTVMKGVFDIPQKKTYHCIDLHVGEIGKHFF